MLRIAAVSMAAISIAISACSTTPRDLEQSTPAHVTTYQENYQEIYRRVSSESRRCYSGNMGAYASAEVDAQLYPDLGFGEITSSLDNYGARNYYWSVKIEKVGEGARMTVNSGNTLNSSAAVSQMQRWAAGGSGC